VSKTDRNGVELSYEYSTNGRGDVIGSCETDSRYAGVVERTFDPLTQDILSMTDRMGLMTTFAYERSGEHGNVMEKSETAPLGGVTTYDYDNYGRVVSITDKHGKTVSITPEFDTAGNMIKRTLSWIEHINGVDRIFEEQEFYSVDGDLVRRIDRSGKEFRYLCEKDEAGTLNRMTTVELNYAGFDTVHYSTGGYGGALAWDGDWNTAQYDEVSGMGSKNLGGTNTFSFNKPKDISYIKAHKRPKSRPGKIKSNLTQSYISSISREIDDPGLSLR